MSETGSATGELGGQQGQSTTGQVQEKVQQTAQQVTGQAQEKAQQVKGQASGRVREQVNTRSTQAGEQVRSLADSMRRTGENLRNEGQENPAKVTEGVAERADRLGGYLVESDADRILGDVESFARRQPWALAAAGVAIGFIASRFVKASSSRRYRSLEDQRRPLASEYGRPLGPEPDVGAFGDDLPAPPPVTAPVAPGPPGMPPLAGEPGVQP